MRWFYNLSIVTYYFAIKCASLFNAKAKLFINGRRNLFIELKAKLSQNTKPVIWIHCSSLGEFEQGRPIIEALKQSRPNTFLLLTFFSPSGYEIRKNYAIADYVAYLPIDTPSNAKQFSDIVNPKLAIFIKYDFWFNIINQCNIKSIPMLFACVNFRPNQIFFKPYGKWFTNQLHKIKHFHVQNLESQKLLNTLGISSIVSGDTRFDRVIANTKSAKEYLPIKKWLSNNFCLVAGSTWPKDEAIIAEFMENFNGKLIIAPHEVNLLTINNLQSKFKNSQLLSVFNPDIESNVLIVDSIGQLASLYQFATVSYVGGGFGKGIHNTLEAIAFGSPVVFGPKYQKFNEAKAIINKQIGFSIHNKTEGLETMNKLISSNLVIIKEEITVFFTENSNATNQIMNTINEILHEQAI